MIRLYTLALADKPAYSAMNRMRRLKNIQPLAKWHLAASYYLTVRRDIAKQMILEVSAIKKENYQNFKNYNYGSTIRDKAIVLEVLNIFEEYVLAKDFVDDIVRKLSSSDWMSTQTTAYSLLAISKFIWYQDISKGFSCNYKLNGDSLGLKSSKSVANIDLVLDQVENGEIEVYNQLEKVLFTSLEIKGNPLYSDDFINNDNNLDMNIKYFSLDDLEINPFEIVQGTDFYVKIENDRDKTTKLAKYLDEFQNFCFDLDINSVLNGSLNFKYR